MTGARGGTRTPTPSLASGPKPGASTNFATRADNFKTALKRIGMSAALWRFGKPAILAGRADAPFFVGAPDPEPCRIHRGQGQQREGRGHDEATHDGHGHRSP